MPSLTRGAPTVAEILVTNFFCLFRVLRELYSHQGQNSESQFLQKVFQCLEFCKTFTLQSDSMVDCYMKTRPEEGHFNTPERMG
jgi:hypothetical protein